MSVNRASEVWKEIKPFAIRDMNKMLDNKAGDSGDDLYAIILYDESAQKIKYYSMSAEGLQAALAAASSGDVVFVPAGTIMPNSSFSPGSEISNGSVPPTSTTGVNVSGLSIGNFYGLEATAPYCAIETSYLRGSMQFNDDGFWHGGLFYTDSRILGIEYLGSIEGSSYSYPQNQYIRIYFQAAATSLYVRVDDEAAYFSDNTGNPTWSIKNAILTPTLTIPAGVELVGLGKNSVINGSINNNGILTNVKVTGAIFGSGISRMVSNPTIELFSNQIKSLIVSGTSPFIVSSTTVNENLNADLLDGEHASAFADAAHTHIESDITDLDHDAVKIDGVDVDLTGITDGQIIKYDLSTTKLIAGDTASAISNLSDVDLTGLADGDVLIYDSISGDWLPETPAVGSSQDLRWFINGALSTGTSVGQSFIISRSSTIVAVYIHCKTPGSSGSTIVDVNKNGTTIFTTQANRPELAYDDADSVAKSGTPDVTSLVENDVVSIDIDQVGTDASSLSVLVVMNINAGSLDDLSDVDLTGIVDGETIVWNATGSSFIPGTAAGGGLDPSGWASADALTYASADDPSFTVTISGDQSAKYTAGMRIKLTQSTGGTKYFIITKVTVSTDTTLTLYGGTDYNLEDEAISNPYYSVVKAPQGFPLNPNKWTVEVTDTKHRNLVNPIQNVWYNPGSINISIPVGLWRVRYSVLGRAYSGNQGDQTLKVTLSTANNSESDADFSTQFGVFQADYPRGMHQQEKILILDTKTTYYLNAMSDVTGIDGLDFLNNYAKCIIRATCIYL